MTLWYISRAAALMAFAAFTLATVLGAAGSGRWTARRPGLLGWRFRVQYLHAAMALTGISLLLVHVGTLVLDARSTIGVSAVLVPFSSAYRPVAVAAGVVAMYLLALATILGAARGRLATSPTAARWWRGLHMSAYAGWALAIGHGFFAGTDSGYPLVALGYLVSLGLVALALTTRWWSIRSERRDPLSRSRAMTQVPSESGCPMSTFARVPAPLALPDIRPIPTWAIGGRRLTAGLDAQARVDLAAHRALHGELPRLTRSALESSCAAVDLRGRGGAAFPVATKLNALPVRGVGSVVVNGSESEPASWKDKLLMRRTPHLVIDGALLVAAAVGAREVVVVVHDGPSAESMQVAKFERNDSARLRVVHSPGWFVAGEASATIRAAEGSVAVPAGRRVLPTARGLDGRPTFLSNVETFAQLAVLATLGREFAATGIGSEPGTTMLTLGGAMERPGVVEVPTGTPLDMVLLAAGIEKDAKVLLGGYHGTFVENPVGLSLSRATVAALGYTIGAGVVQAVGPNTCGWREVAEVAHWLAAQTAGQCGPCVFGLPAVAADVDKIGRGVSAERDLVRHLGMLDGRGACAHPSGAVRFLRSAVAAFSDEIAVHVHSGGCGRPYLGELPMPGSLRR